MNFKIISLISLLPSFALVSSPVFSMDNVNEGENSPKNSSSQKKQKKEDLFEEEMKIFESVARDEGGIAMLYVAEMYYSERYYKYKKTIFEWCFKAADWGHKSAQSLKNIVYNEKNTKPILYNDDIQTYGGTFIFSEEIDNNHEAVQKFLEKVAQKGSGEALYKLGCMCRFGKHKDLKKAEEYFLQAVEKENVSAMSSLGEMYHIGGNHKFPFIDTIEEGTPFEKNINKAIE